MMNDNSVVDSSVSRILGKRFSAPASPLYRENLSGQMDSSRGRCEDLMLRPGLQLMIRDVVASRDIYCEKEASPALHVGIILDGAEQCWGRILSSHKQFPLRQGQVSLMTINAPVRGGMHIPAGIRLRWIDIRFEPGFVDFALGDDPLFADRDLVVERSLDEKGIRLSYIRADTAIKQAVAQVMAISGRTMSERLFLEGKSIEILALAIGLLVKGRRRTEVPAVRRKYLSCRDRQCVRKAREILFDDIENAPRVRELAHQVGLNEDKLKYGFRQEFGNSVYATLQERRMQMAARLLEKGDASVTNVAMAVGYSNVAHFAKIFRWYHGTAPSHYLHKCKG